jgi:hypothetical protein
VFYHYSSRTNSAFDGHHHILVRHHYVTRMTNEIRFSSEMWTDRTLVHFSRQKLSRIRTFIRNAMTRTAAFRMVFAILSVLQFKFITELS